MKRFKCVYMYGDHSPFSFKTSKERKKLWSYLPLFSLNASSFVVWFSLRDSEKTQPSLLKSSISHISSNQAHYFLCILWKPFCKSLFYLPRCFLNPWYIGSYLLSYLIIFVQKYNNQQNIRNEGFSFQFAIFYRLSILMI